jgi:hypothetical protein
MKIHDIGGEFALIDRLARQSAITHPDLVAGIGDDAAVIGGSLPDADCLLVTTDMLVETSHFRRDWATPEQIGIKAVACNVSDIAAMGGIPTFMFVSLALSPETEVAWVERLYRGMADACRRYGVVLAGGDTTHGEVVTISITLLGRVSTANLRLRSHASSGEHLCVTGSLGGSAAGLAMLSAGSGTVPRPERKTSGTRVPTGFLHRSPPGPGHDRYQRRPGGRGQPYLCDQSGTGADLRRGGHPHPPVRATRPPGGPETTPLILHCQGGRISNCSFPFLRRNKQRLTDQGIHVATVGHVTDAVSGRMLTLPRWTPHAPFRGLQSFLHEG